LVSHHLTTAIFHAHGITGVSAMALDTNWREKGMIHLHMASGDLFM
jgi:hypothetical protein